MCALALAQAGHPGGDLFEAEPALTHDLRAGSFHPPTLEMMAPYGITEQHARDAASRCGTGRSATGPATWSPSSTSACWQGRDAYPYRLHLEQHRLTPIQLDMLRRDRRRRNPFRPHAHQLRAERRWRHGDGRRRRRRTHRRRLLADRRRRRPQRRCAKSSTSSSRASPGRNCSWWRARPTISAQHGFALNCYIADPVEWGALFKLPDERPARPVAAGLSGQPGRKRRSVARRPSASRRRCSGCCRKTSLTRCATRAPTACTSALPRRFAPAACCSPAMPRISTTRSAASGSTAASTTRSISPTSSAAVWRGEDTEDVLDLYSRQRRAATIEQVQAMSIRNKRMMEERDPTVQRRESDRSDRDRRRPGPARASTCSIRR